MKARELIGQIRYDFGDWTGERLRLLESRRDFSYNESRGVIYVSLSGAHARFNVVRASLFVIEKRVSQVGFVPWHGIRSMYEDGKGQNDPHS